MRHENAAVRHHAYQIPQAQLEARVPGDTQNDDLPVEVPSFEQIFDRDEPLHLFIIACHPRVCTRAEEGDKIKRLERDRSEANEPMLICRISRREYDLVHAIDISQG